MRSSNLIRFIRRRKWCRRSLYAVLAALSIAVVITINLMYKGWTLYGTLEKEFYKIRYSLKNVKDLVLKNLTQKMENVAMNIMVKFHENFNYLTINPIQLLRNYSFNYTR